MARELPEHDAVTGERAALRLNLRVVPNASRAELVGWLEPGLLKVKVTAPPEGGRANKEVVALLAKSLGLTRREVSIVAGEKSRQKVAALRGIDEATLAARLGA